MEVKVVSKTKNELKIEIIGEDHTFCNLLQNALLNDKNVEIAGYDQPHPLIRSSIIYLRTKREASPEKALLSALEYLKEENKEFDEKFSKAVDQS
ncbi:MAG TPA: DNA-directed RNA polymerase subunit L [Candidatus Saccharimonadales bacterium]|jgi:DNA-directed RNA polymerase subunit L|nr:DNA-directed RNA polymerase subunit L [Candidatus Saccharimonadales bacterium]